MRIENGKLALETRECHSCNGTRRVNGWVNCDKCKGKGKGSNGRRCPACANNFHSSILRGKVLALDIEACTTCTDGTEKETRYDSMPDSFFSGLTFVVYRSGRHQTFTESLLGAGVYSCTDYGSHQSMTDEALIAKVREHTYVQACKVTDEALNFCDHVGIFTNSQGYSVIPVFGKPEPIQTDLERQLTPEAGLAIGSKLANEGLNGTMLAAKFRR